MNPSHDASQGEVCNWPEAEVRVTQRNRRELG
jgi:hypothetical protein